MHHREPYSGVATALVWVAVAVAPVVFVSGILFIIGAIK